MQAMDQRFCFDTLADSLVPDAAQAMILFEENAENEGWHLMEDLRPLVGQQAVLKPMNDTAPFTFLIYLPAERLHEAVLRLTAHGIKRLKAVQPVSLEAPSCGKGK